MDDEERAALRDMGVAPEDLRVQLGQAWVRLILREHGIRLELRPRSLPRQFAPHDSFRGARDLPIAPS